MIVVPLSANCCVVAAALAVPCAKAVAWKTLPAALLADAIFLRRAISVPLPEPKLRRLAFP